MSREQRLNSENGKPLQKAWDTFEDLHAKMEALEDENEKLWQERKAFCDALYAESEWHDARVRALPDGPECEDHNNQAMAIRRLINGFNPKYSGMVKKTVEAVREATKDLLSEPTDEVILAQMEDDVQRVISELMTMEGRQKNIEVTIEPLIPSRSDQCTVVLTGLTQAGNDFLQRVKDKIESDDTVTKATQ